MDVVPLDVVKRREGDREARVVEGRQDPADGDEQEHGDHVARHQPHGEEVQVLAREELKRVHVDGVRVAAARGLLFVVVLVDPPEGEVA